jgi:hypothetical protein
VRQVVDGDQEEAARRAEAHRLIESFLEDLFQAVMVKFVGVGSGEKNGIKWATIAHCRLVSADRPPMVEAAGSFVGKVAT